MRGRIICPFVAVLAQLDTKSTTYDPLFREPRVSIDTAGQRTRERAETEKRCRCQVETGTFELQQMTAAGNAALSSLTLVFHFSDLDDAGLVGDDNRALINVNDRLLQLLRADDGGVEADFSKVPPYITEATPSGFGFGGRVNLLVCRLSDRPQAAQRGG